MAPILTSLASIVKQYGITALAAGSAGGGPSGITATGGVISDYEVSGTFYRAHIFTSSGTFDVTALGDFGDTVEYLVVGGGGGGSHDDGGGGGAGGFRTNLAGHPLAAPSYAVSVGEYTVTVGGGGGGSGPGSPGVANPGGNSEFFPTPVSYPSTQRIRSVGGGAGARGTGAQAGDDGGSGGGRGWNGGPTDFGTGNTPPDPNHPQPQGYPGGACTAAPNINGGGGGGAGGAGSPGADPEPHGGGAGLQCVIAGPPTFTGVGALNPGPGQYQWFAGGGGGGGRSADPRAGGVGGGGDGGGPTTTTGNGQSATGGGGGGYGPSGGNTGGNGGSGIVVVRYQIGQLTATQKATGGAISYYNDGSGMKTIHTFTSSGVFNVTNGPLSVEYVVVAGGASGGIKGGGGGAGGYRTATGFTVNPGPNTVTVGAGGAQAYGVFNSPASLALGKQGTASVFSTIVSQGGGGGGCDSSNTAGVNGGSGGGAAGGGYGVGTAGLGNRGDGTNQPSATTVPTQGNNGASNVASSPYAGGGGGGAGSAGNSPGPGGTGVQVPTTFQNPASAPGPNGGGLGYPGSSGTYWLAGGGGGGSDVSPTSTGGGPGGPYAGAGNGGVASAGVSALANSGSGGGGGTPSSNNPTLSGAGGSGIVLIAYPS